MKRRKNISIIKNPKLRIKNSVLICSENLHIEFFFSKFEEAKEFALTAVKSISVSGVSLFKNGKFIGGKDGAGS